MFKNLILFIFTALINGPLLAQDLNDKVLITVDGDQVKVDEFLMVYQKNLELVKDESQRDIDGYLKLYSNYLLKLKEAYALGYDKTPKYIKEFNSYKKQLSRNYLTDKEITDRLVEEAYERMSQDVWVKHILVRLDESSGDTSAVYNQIMAFRDRLINEDFETIQKDSHNGNSVFVEDLGYFSAFKMVYDFETVAYNTAVGEVSQPFRTRFGYHVLKVFDKRESRGEVTVGHIFLSKNKPDSLGNPEDRIRNIFKMLQQGQSFEDLAKQFSEDPSSSKRGGRLNTFKSGQLSSVKFENMAFSLSEPDEISEPFETDFGWHIAKLYDKKPLAPFSELRAQLEARIKRDSRSSVINEAFISSLKKDYGVNTDVDLSYFSGIIDESYYRNEWSKPSDIPSENLLISIGSKELTYADFASYLEKNQKRIRDKKGYDQVVKSQFDDFINKELLNYHEANLENVNPDYAKVLKEYREGLLLFDLMEDKIWNAVKEDSIGLRTYFDENIEKYAWTERFKGILVSSAEEDELKNIRQALSSGMSYKEIRSTYEGMDNNDLLWTNRSFEKGSSRLPANLEYKPGTTEIYKHNGTWHVLRIDELIPAGPKTFEEARGSVINDYQNKLESDWLKALAKKYTISIDHEVLNELKSTLNKR